MIKVALLAIFISGTFSTTAQITDLIEKFDLPPTLKESSGVIFFNDKLISHNDSGNKNELYELDTLTGVLTRIVTIENATNVDWEDITQDETSIYIGDIGNNNGSRNDLRIYKIRKDDYLNSDNVTAEVIDFKYSDQVDFTSNPNNTEWDSEALVAFDTSLILLTKNWVSGVTKAYSIPMNSGSYSVDPLASTLTSGGLITGATYNKSTGKLFMTGYSSILQPFIWISESFAGKDIFSGTNTKISLTNLGLMQIEAITHIGQTRFFMTSEAFDSPAFSSDAKLLSFSNKNTVLSTREDLLDQARTFPNPVSDMLIIDGIELASVEIYDENSRLVLRSNNQRVNISMLNNGMYLVKINLKNDNFLIKKIIKE